MLFAIQLKKGLKWSQDTYVASLIKIKGEQYVEVRNSIVKILKEFRDAMPTKLAKKLPPQWLIDHKIELLPRTKPSAQAPYRMSLAEWLELQKQLKKLLDVGLIQLSRAPSSAPVLFHEKQDGTLHTCVNYRAMNKVTIKKKMFNPFGSRIVWQTFKGFLLLQIGFEIKLLVGADYNRR